MNVIAGYQGRAVVQLDDIASLADYPGKLDMTRADVSAKNSLGTP